MVTNILIIKCDSVGSWLCEISNTKATSKAEFMKKLNNIDAELKKSVADIQKACITINKNSAVCLKPHNLPSVSKLITF